MRSRDVVGKRIVRVHQERVWNTQTASFVWDVAHLELEDGTLVWATAVEGEACYYTEFTSLKPGRQT